METFLGIIIGMLIAFVVFIYIKNRSDTSLSKSQSIILLDKIKTVCKCITVEGDFAEIYHYEAINQRFLKLVSSKKKAIIIIKAKAYVGFDLSKLKIAANSKSKVIVLTHFPLPEILSIDTNLTYYDIKNGLFNKFEASDLTQLQQEAKQHIRDKIPESGLMQTAKKEALVAIELMENIVKTIGWKLDYTALKTEKINQKTIN